MKGTSANVKAANAPPIITKSIIKVGSLLVKNF